jgi:hypothetical protein
MLPRSWMVVIVVFWLLVCGLLVRRDLWPRFAADEPSPYAIAMVDEPRVGLTGRQNPQTADTLWTVYRNKIDPKSDAGRVFTRFHYDVSTRTLIYHSGEFTVKDDVSFTPPVKMEDLDCRLEWNGRLRGVSVKIQTRNPDTELAELSVRLEASVKAGRLVPRWELRDPLKNDGTVELSPRDGPPAELSPGGNLFIPVQPPNRMLNLRAGQSWRVPCLDLIAATGPNPRLELRQLQATVREDTLRWKRQPVPCLVVEYAGDDALAPRTWVRKSDLLVLLQEFNYNGDRLLIHRDSER